ncbi:MAG: hypothetical protein ACI8RD_000336 [Bacillariaceae sp.]|jgi:hypothetical protein
MGDDHKRKREKKKEKNVWHPNFQYEVDYNDHFETPIEAYQHISPLLDLVLKENNTNNDDDRLRKDCSTGIIYDPYYCNGRTKIILNTLGFNNVVHEKRDFYKDIENLNVPDHHILITNPPYSDSHKERCLEYCIKQYRTKNISFFLLMPNYVAARNYYRRILGDTINDVAYYVPNKGNDYNYSHPEGTGKEVSPFSSLWFCCIGKDVIKKYNGNTINKTSHEANSKGQDRGPNPNFVKSFEELVSLGVISLQNRPNPKKRKKMRKEVVAAQTQSFNTTSIHNHNSKTKPIQHNNPATKEVDIKGKKMDSTSSTSSSKYRNTNGKRTKKRF